MAEIAEVDEIEMIVPSDHQAIAGEYVRLEGEIHALVEPLDEERLNSAEPRTDGNFGWSVAQCVDHLSRTNAIYLPALAAAAEKGRREGRARRDALDPGWLGRWFVGVLEPPVKRRFKAPLPEIRPAASIEKVELLAEFSRRQAAAIELVRSTGDLDLSRIRFRNPLMSNLRFFNLATGFLLIAAHERRHLWQAKRVAGALGARGS